MRVGATMILRSAFGANSLARAGAEEFRARLENIRSAGSDAFL
jgi:hypothetical protein